MKNHDSANNLQKSVHSEQIRPKELCREHPPPMKQSKRCNQDDLSTLLKYSKLAFNLKNILFTLVRSND